MSFAAAIREILPYSLVFRKRNVLVGLVLLLTHTSSAQSDDLNFINFSNRDGLSANSINTILKDKHGYMWFGTDDGLNKFDGETFTVYRHHADDSTSLGSSRINAICEDSLGNLWIGTGESLSYYDRKKDAFKRCGFVDNILIRALCIDHSGNLWAGSYGGLFRLDAHSGKVTRYTAADKPGQLISNTIVAVYEDRKHRLWIGTNNGLHLYSKETNSFKLYRHDKNDSLSISDNIIRAIAEDSKGNLWIGTNDGGIARLRPDGKGFTNYKSDPANVSTLSNNRVFSIAAAPDGKLWIGTEDGINILDPLSGIVTRVINDYRNKYSLADKSVRSIFIDSNGIYWVGTFQGGVCKYDKNLVFFNLRQSNPFDQFGLSGPKVTSFVEDPKGDIYVGTDGGGLNHYHRKTGLFCHFELNKDGNNKLSILAMERVNNELWIGTYGQGLYILNMLTKAVTHFEKGNGPMGLSSNDIFCLKKVRNGNIWIGTNGDGVDVYQPGAGIIHRFNKESATEQDRLAINGFVRAIEEDDKGNTWIGTNGSGIAVYNPLLKKFNLLNRGNSNLPVNNVSSVCTGHDGTMWVSTLGGGISKLDSHGKFISYSEGEGLSNAVVYKILESEPGKLWVSTNKGISSFDINNVKFKNYTYQNGLQKSTFSLNAGLKTSSGELFFGGLDGFNFFNPRALSVNKVVPSLVFTDLKISNRSVLPGPNEAIKEHISVAKKITLGYKQNFSLDFVALNYTAPQESQYSYKLEGFDKDWNSVGSLHKAVYTNLDPGHYTFRLKAASDDGLWNSPEASIDIYVKPPFWRTIYAYVFYALVFIGFLIAWRYWGIRRLKNKFAREQERLQFKQMIEQERKEAEQKHELDQVKIKFLTNLSHEFRTPISLIVSPTEKLLNAETSDTKVEQLSLIRRNARRLLNLVNQLLDFRKLEENEMKLSLTEGDLVSFVKEVGDSFKDISERKHIGYSFSGSLPHYYTSFDRDKIERILFNLLSNAFKFTRQDGKIELRIEPGNESGIKILVTDTGVGMSPGMREKIFDRFFQGEANPGIMNQGSGIGLSITREFIKLHGGTIDVESLEGKGSTFIIQLPCTPIQATGAVALPLTQAEKDSLAANGSKDIETPALDKPTLLIIEDHEDFRHYLSQNLKLHFKIVEAADGKQGWQKALSSHPQVIVSDINMPEMDGITLCRKIKSDKRTSHIPIILLTALTGDTNQLIGLNTGANDYLSKPFNFEILHLKIKNLLHLNQNLKDVYSRQLKVATPEVEVESEDEKLLLKITEYIEANIDSSDLSVEELSKHVHMSRGSLYNKILTLTGETPVEFIRSIKLNKAAALLEHSDMKISEIGYEVGFTTPNYFARAFKAKFNISPSEYISLKRKNQ